MVRHNANGTTIRHLQLAHNRRDPETKRPTATVIYNFGREDQVDREAIRRLVRSLSRLLPPPDAARAQAEAQGLTFTASRPLGGAWLLDALWRQLHLDRLAVRLWGRRKFQFPGQAQQCTEHPGQSAILTALGAAPPPRIFALTPAGRTSAQ